MRSSPALAWLCLACATPNVSRPIPDADANVSPSNMRPEVLTPLSVLRGRACLDPVRVDSPAAGTEPTVRTATKGKQIEVDVEAEGVSIGRLMETLARRTGRSLVMSSDLGSRAVWVHLRGVRLEAARDPEGLTLNLESPPELVVRVIPEQPNSSSLAPLTAELLLSCHGRVFSDPTVRALVVWDLESIATDVERLVRTLDFPPRPGDLMTPIRAPEASSLTASCPAPARLAAGQRHAGALIIERARASSQAAVVGCGGGRAFYAARKPADDLPTFAAQLGLAVRESRHDPAQRQDFLDRARRGVSRAGWVHDFRANPSGVTIGLNTELSRALSVHPEKIEVFQTETATLAIRAADLISQLGLGRASARPDQHMLIVRGLDEDLGRTRRLLRTWQTLSSTASFGAREAQGPQSLESRCSALQENGIDAHDAEQYEQALGFYRSGLEVCEKKRAFLHEMAWTLAALGEKDEAAQLIVRAFREYGGNRILAGNLELLLNHVSSDTKNVVRSLGKSVEDPIYADIPTEYLWTERIACLGAEPTKRGRRGSLVHGGARFDVWEVECPGESPREIYFNVDGDPRLKRFAEELKAIEREESPPP